MPVSLRRPAALAAAALVAAGLPDGLRAQTAATVPPQHAPPADPAAAALVIRRVTQGDARPDKGWRPPQAPAEGLRLAHAPGERLDEAWVRRQFALNGLPSPGALDRALALVQLINKAFLSAGYLNSGLVVRSSADAGELDLDLVYGAVTAGAPTAVQWLGGGPRGLDASYLRDRLPSALRRPLNGSDLERDFRLLAEDPAIRTINAELRPGASPGEATLALSVYPQDRSDLYVVADNSRSPSVGGERAGVGGYLRNVFGPGDLLSGEAGVTRGLKDASVSYVMPLLSPRTSLSLGGAFNNAAVVSRPLVPLDIRARDRSYQLGLTRRFVEAPLLPAAEPGRWSPARTLSGGVLLAHRVSRTSLQGEPFSFGAGAVNGRSRYTVVRLTGDYLVRGVDQVFAFSLTGTRGLSGSGSDVPGAPAPRPHFQTLVAQLNYARRLSDKGLELRARLQGQLSDSLLYSGERLSAGGASTVRGYRENLILADEGAIGSVELAQPLRLARAANGGRGLDWGAFTLAAFMDGAVLRNVHAPQPDGPIYSLGAALAWSPSEALTAQVAYGRALKKATLSGARDIQDRGLSFHLIVRPLRLR